MMRMKKIPIHAAAFIANDYGYDQVVIIARRVGKGEHVTTYGVDKEHCKIAARMGECLQAGVMGWPGVLHPDAAKLAIEYSMALDDDRGAMEFLRLWHGQQWAAIRQDYDMLPVNMLPVNMLPVGEL